MKLGKEEFKAECFRRRDAGLLLQHDGSYDARDEIKALGAIWDSREKGWLMPDPGAYETAYAAAETHRPGGGKSPRTPAPVKTQQTPQTAQTPVNTEDIPF